MEFAAVLEQFGLKQHVTEPTHLLGGWLDVIVTRDDCRVSDVTVFPPVLSDHGLVAASIFSSTSLYFSPFVRSVTGKVLTVLHSVQHSELILSLLIFSRPPDALQQSCS